MPQKKKVSVRFIADQCGVSTATVSRVLNNDDNVTEATRKRVLEVLEQFQYEAPNPPPPKVSKVGVIIVSGQSDYYHAVLAQIGVFFRDQGISVVAMNTEGFPNYLPVALETLYDSNVQGVILVSCDYASVRDRLSSKVPHVWVDCNDPPEETEKICQVQSDHLVSGRMAAQELMRSGCKRPIVLMGENRTHRSLDRLRGFIAGFASGGIILDDSQVIALPGLKSHVTQGQEMVRYLITRDTDFDGVFAMNDGWAMGAYMGLTQSGLRVPEDVKLVGFDGISKACTEVLNITSIQQNVPLLARYAGEMLLQLIAREPVAEKRIIVPTNVLYGRTT